MNREKYKILIQIYIFLDTIYGLFLGTELLLRGSTVNAYRFFYIIVYPLLLGWTFWTIGRRIKIDIAVGVLIQALIWIFVYFRISVIDGGIYLGGVGIAIYMLVFRCLPLYALLRTCKTYEGILDNTFPFVFISCVYTFVYYLGVNQKLYSSTDYMTFSYNLVYPCVIAFLTGVVQKKKIYVAFSIAFLICITINGARGALLCAALSIVFIVIWKRKKTFAHDLLFWGSIIVAIITVYFFREEIVFGLAKTFPNSRTIFILQRDFLTGRIDSTGRDVVYEYCIDYIKKNIFGCGLFQDRILIKTNLLSDPKEEWIGCYPHNLFLEIIMQWGWIVGSIIVALIIILLGRVLKTLNQMEEGDISFFILIVCTTFIMLMISSSYLYSYKFYASLAVLITLLGKKPKTKSIKE